MIDLMSTMTRRNRKRTYFYAAIAASLAAIVCLGIALYGAIGADQISIASQINAIRDYAIFGGSLVIAAMIMWVLFFQT